MIAPLCLLNINHRSLDYANRKASEMSNAAKFARASLVSPAMVEFQDAVFNVAGAVDASSDTADIHKADNAYIKGLATKATWLMIPVLAPINDPDARIETAEGLAEDLAKARGVSKAALRDERQKARFLVDHFDTVAATPDETRAKKNALTVARDLAREAKALNEAKAERDAIDADAVAVEVAKAGPWSSVSAMLMDPAGQDAFNRAMNEAVERKAKCEAFRTAWEALNGADRAMFLLSL